MKFKDLTESLKSNTAYMFRRSGELIYLPFPFHPYFVTALNYEDFNLEDLYDVSFNNEDNIIWYYNNTRSNSTKVLIEKINTIFNSLIGRYIFKIPFIDIYENEKSEDLLISYIHVAEDNLNQEFTRVRTSDPYFAGIDNHSIYFRISSKGYNWFNDIWKFVYNNKNWITSVTILKDDKKARLEDDSYDEVYYIHNGLELNKVPIDAFITLSGNPIIENYNNRLEKSLANGNLVIESFPGTGTINIHKFYSTIKENYEI